MPAVSFLAADTYLIASWWDWQFGGSFGHRGFVDALPFFAIGLAAFYHWAFARRGRGQLVAAIVAGGIALNLFQMAQYWNHILPFSDTTWDLYREVFLRWR